MPQLAKAQPSGLNLPVSLTGPPLPGQTSLLGIELGDVIITRSRNPDRTDRLIHTGQRYAYPDAHALFTHTALYVGNDHVIDATPAQNVAIRPLHECVAGCDFRVLRFKGITPSVQWDVAYRAVNARGNYSTLKAVVDGLIANAPLPASWSAFLAQLAADVVARDAYYCSQFVDQAYLAAFKATVVDPWNPVPLPATFAASSSFTDQAVHWKP